MNKSLSNVNVYRVHRSKDEITINTKKIRYLFCAKNVVKMIYKSLSNMQNRYQVNEITINNKKIHYLFCAKNVVKMIYESLSNIQNRYHVNEWISLLQNVVMITRNHYQKFFNKICVKNKKIMAKI